MNFLLLVCLFQSCSSKEEHTIQTFVEKYANTNFELFKGKSLFARGFDNGNPIIFIYDYSETDKPCGFVSVLINSKTEKLINIKVTKQRDSCNLNFNNQEYFNLALAFLKYDINYIKVDNNLNIFVSVLFYEGPPNLIRFSDTKYITDSKVLIHIKDNWYQRTK